MGRLCERPGCSDPASVAYGMRAEDLVFWLDQIGDRSGDDHGVLCQRHADTMVVPRNWTLDDLRDPDLHLFRPPTADPGKARRVRRGPADVRTPPEQLELGAQIAALDNDAEVLPDEDSDVAEDGGSESPDAKRSDTWSPSFDSDSDLGGLLAARSPLLARAFRGDDRPRE